MGSVKQIERVVFVIAAVIEADSAAADPPAINTLHCKGTANVSEPKTTCITTNRSMRTPLHILMIWLATDTSD